MSVVEEIKASFRDTKAALRSAQISIQSRADEAFDSGNSDLGNDLLDILDDLVDAGSALRKKENQALASPDTMDAVAETIKDLSEDVAKESKRLEVATDVANALAKVTKVLTKILKTISKL